MSDIETFDDAEGTEPEPARTVIYDTPVTIEVFHDLDCKKSAGELEEHSLIVLEHDNSIMLQLMPDGSDGEHIGHFVREADLDDLTTPNMPQEETNGSRR